MKAFLKRLFEEQEGLENKILALDHFLETRKEKGIEISKMEVNLLEDQCFHMKEYAKSLKNRIIIAAFKDAFHCDLVVPETPNWDKKFTKLIKDLYECGKEFLYTVEDKIVYKVLSPDSIRSIGKFEYNNLVLISEERYDALSDEHKVVRSENTQFNIEIEEEIIAKGLNAPRVKLDRLDEVIANEKYVRVTEKFMICILTLVNGFEVIGESSCVDPRNFDEALGKKISKQNAKNKIWPLEGYLLKQKEMDNKNG